MFAYFLSKLTNRLLCPLPNEGELKFNNIAADKNLNDAKRLIDLRSDSIKTFHSARNVKKRRSKCRIKLVQGETNLVRPTFSGWGKR